MKQITVILSLSTYQTSPKYLQFWSKFVEKFFYLNSTKIGDNDEKILSKKRRSKKSKMPQLQARNKITSHKFFQKHTVQYKSARDELKDFRFKTCQILWRKKIMNLKFY